jgi:hypothetical protein
MDDPAMCYKELDVDYTIQRRKRKGLVVYLEVDFSINDVEPSNITTLFLLLLL